LGKRLVTTPQSVLAAFAIILVDLFARAGLDKVLALIGSPETIALWAQLQSVVELVSAVTIVGVYTGLTVMIAQLHEPSDEPVLLRHALKLAFVTALSVALLVAFSSSLLSAWLTQRKISATLFLLAALIGCIAILPATLNAYWLGKHQQQRMLRLALLTSLTLLMVASGAWLKLPLGELLMVQCAVLAIIGFACWLYLRKLLRTNLAQKSSTDYRNKLMKFVPVGLAIGIMSPVSMLLIRGILAQTLSWDEAGIMQALWRATEWITASAAGVLSLIFLPRFSNAYGSLRFKSELSRAGAMVLIPTAFLLVIIYLNQHTILTTLYDSRFAVSDATTAWFMLGCWIRIASWVFLFGLFAAHRTKLIIVGELFSLPLYAMLLWLFADGMTLERAAIMCLVSYGVYLIFNIIALLNSTTKSKSNFASENFIL
jgi:O-antigen/teichoic acid export membrane protein